MSEYMILYTHNLIFFMGYWFFFLLSGIACSDNLYSYIFKKGDKLGTIEKTMLFPVALGYNIKNDLFGIIIVFLLTSIIIPLFVGGWVRLILYYN